MSILNDFCNGDLNIINLKFRKDRKALISEHLDLSGSTYNFVDATYGNEMYDVNIDLIPPWQGLRDTVIKILKSAIENGTEILPVLEDDCRLVDNWEAQFKDAIENHLPETWDVLHLGGIDGRWCSRQYSGNVFKVREGLMMHFIYAKKRILQPWLDKMLEIPELTPDVALAKVYSDMDSYQAYRIDIATQDPETGSDCIKKAGN